MKLEIWPIELDQAAPVNHFAQLLNQDETTRAARFHFERDSRRYTIGRASLRMILSYYTGLDPAALRFTYNDYGKPSLPADQNPDDVQFNLSHTGGYALCAVTIGHPVGIDVEEIRNLDYLQLATAVFSPQEQTELKQLPEHQQPRAFFSGWTRKEAYIKAHGRGLSMSLTDFDVTLTPDKPARLLATRPDPTEVNHWTLFGWSVDTKRVAALAVVGQGWRIAWRENNDIL